MGDGTAGVVDPGDEVVAFGRAFNALCRAWFWWIVVGSVRISGLPAIGGIVLALVVLFWLVRLQRATTDVVARYLRACVAVAIVATVVLVVATLRHPDMIDPGDSSPVWAVVAVGLLLFCRAMQPWFLVHDSRRLLARWHRSEVWTRIVAGGGGIYLAVLSVGGPSVGDVRLAGRHWVFLPLWTSVAVVVLGSFLSVWNSAGATNDALRAYRAP
ncbi:MAG TPA: hypothetical protein VKB57_03195 [Acidimicrobiales bacterium]|nr:hypothetical protein [Acidimicrobiales bacterium]